MSILDWLTGKFSERGKALSSYRRGMAKARKHDHRGAIHEYSVVIDMTATPPDVKAMALYNRALVYDAIHNQAKAIEDLSEVLAMPAAQPSVKTEAKRKLVRMDRRLQGEDDSGPAAVPDA